MHYHTSVQGKAFFTAVSIALFLTGCSTKEVPMEARMRNEPFDVQIAIEPSMPSTSESTMLRFSIHKDGEPNSLYPDYVPQVTVVSANLQDFAFYFIDSIEDEGEGVFSVPHDFTQSGDYHIWLDIVSTQSRDHHRDKTSFRGFHSITLQGDSLPASQSHSNQSVTIEPFTFSLQPPNPVKQFDFQPFTLTVERADGGPVEFLNSLDHYYVIAAPELGEFRLHHFSPDNRADRSIQTEQIAFDKPGEYIFWAHLFLREGVISLPKSVSPLFYLSVLPSESSD